MYDTLPLIQKLDLDYIDLEGYVNLRCNWKHCPEAYILPQPGHDDSIWEAHGEYAKAWKFIFPNETLPEKVAAPCCAQFAIDRRTIHRWPVAQYERVRAWIWSRDGDLPSMKSGIILEYMWHILFGKPAYWCAPVKPCYCGTWNICDLDCDEAKGWCKGRIWTPDPPPSMPVCKCVTLRRVNSLNLSRATGQWRARTARPGQSKAGKRFRVLPLSVRLIIHVIDCLSIGSTGLKANDSIEVLGASGI